MKEHELIEAIQADLAENGFPPVPAVLVEAVLESASRLIIESLGEGARIELPGLVSMQVRIYKAADERLN